MDGCVSWRTRFCFLILGVLALGIGSFPASANPEAGFASLQRRIMELYDSHHTAVVRVKAAFTREANEDAASEDVPEITVKYGTAFFISREGHLLANASRVVGAERVWIEHEGISYAAELIGADFATNLALLRALALPDDFTHLRLPDSNELPPIASMVLLISCPLEFAPSPFFGLISGRESHFFDQVFPTTYIRTNIPAGLGEGGSPILDLNGNLVGIIVAGLVDVQGSYCLPARAARRIRDDLLFSGEVRYGWLGFEATERVTEDRGREVVLTGVTSDAPADEAGLQADDLLLRIGSFKINGIDDVRDALFYTRVDQFVDIDLLRDSEPITLSVRVATRPEGEPFVSPVERRVREADDSEQESEESRN